MINNSICSLAVTLPTESRPSGSGVEKRGGGGGGGKLEFRVTGCCFLAPLSLKRVRGVS